MNRITRTETTLSIIGLAVAAVVALSTANALHVASARSDAHTGSYMPVEAKILPQPADITASAVNGKSNDQAAQDNSTDSGSSSTPASADPTGTANTPAQDDSPAPAPISMTAGAPSAPAASNDQTTPVEMNSNTMSYNAVMH